MKTFFFTILLVIISSCAASQVYLSLGGEYASPQSYGLSMNANTGIGGSARLQSIFGKRISGIATLGYIPFQEKKYSDMFSSYTTNFRAIPAQLGIKLYPTSVVQPSGLFLSAELGLMFTKMERDYTSNTIEDFSRTYTDLSVAPGIGYQFKNIEPSFRLQYNLSDAGFNVYYYNLRLAYSFKIGSGKNY